MRTQTDLAEGVNVRKGKADTTGSQMLNLDLIAAVFTYEVTKNYLNSN